jgi:hypothetical protein
MASKLLPIFFSLFLSANAAEPAPSPSPSPAPTLRESIDALEAPQLQEALDVLQKNFLSSGEFDETARQRALLEGMAVRLAPGVLFVSGEAEPKPASHAFLAEILDEKAGYIRPGAIDSSALAQLDAALEKFSGKELPAVILDLRQLAGGSAFDTAAEFAKRFCPKGTILFTIQKPGARQERILTSDSEPHFKGIVVVLCDSGTSGAAEALAASLRANADAMVVGGPTAGQAVEFSDFALGGGRTLRVAVSRVAIPEAGPLFPGGVKPDILVDMDAATTEDIFRRSPTEGLGRFVFDLERPRMNEAALMANTNPEISGDSESPAESEPLRDTALQRALDLVVAVVFYRKQ